MGVVLLPWVPNILLPLTVLFWIGIGSSWANMLLGTQISLSVPNAYLSRIGSIMGFMCNGISPLGVAAAGILISSLGLSKSLLYMGANHKEAEKFFENNYPGVF